MSKKRSLLILTILIQLFFIYTLFSANTFGKFYIVDSSRGDIDFEYDNKENLSAVVVGGFYRWSYDWQIVRTKPFINNNRCVSYTLPDSSYAGNISDYNWDELGYYKYDEEINENNIPLEKLSEMITDVRKRVIDREGGQKTRKYNVSVLRIDKMCHNGSDYKNYYYGITYVKSRSSDSQRKRRQPGSEFNNAKKIKYDEWDIKYPGLDYNRRSGTYDEITAVTSTLNIMLLNPATFIDTVLGYDEIFVPFSDFNVYHILQNKKILERENNGEEPAMIILDNNGVTYRYKKSIIREKKF